MELIKLIDLARYETGSYKNVAEKMRMDATKISNWKKGKIKPSPAEIMQLAEIAGLNPVPTFMEVMMEIDLDNKELWKKWRPHGDSNPGYRRERAMS